MSDNEIMQKLTRPFELHQVQWKPQVVKEGTAMMVPYIDARDVAERLDEIFGPMGWQLDHKEVGGQTLSGIGIRIEGEWTWKWDIGFVPRRGDENIALKGSLSDGLKRAAVLLGIARYLYRVPPSWCDAETYKKGDKIYVKRLKEQPTMPAWATPEGGGHPPEGTARVKVGAGAERSNSAGKKDEKASTQKATNGNTNWTDRFWEKTYSYDLSREQGLEFVEKADGDLEAAFNLLVAEMEPPAEEATEEVPF